MKQFTADVGTKLGFMFFYAFFCIPKNTLYIEIYALYLEIYILHILYILNFNHHGAGSDDFCDQNEMITLITTDGHAVCRAPVRDTRWTRQNKENRSTNSQSLSCLVLLYLRSCLSCKL